MATCDICGNEFKNNSGLSGHKQLAHRFESAYPSAPGAAPSALPSAAASAQERLLEQFGERLLEQIQPQLEQLERANEHGARMTPQPTQRGRFGRCSPMAG